jgi:hypothetical protein
MVIPGAGENSAALQISPAALQNSDAPAAFHSSLVTEGKTLKCADLRTGGSRSSPTDSSPSGFTREPEHAGAATA